MTQNTDEWLAWRREGIGSSDIPAIMGVCPYRTIMDVYLDKIGEGKPIKSNPAMELGSKFESAARAIYFFDKEIDLEPATHVNSDYPFIRASLDGEHKETKLFVEIKYMGIKNFEKIALEQKALPHHWTQIQWQYLATGYKQCIYISYTLNEDKTQIDKIQYITINEDLEYKKMLLEHSARFWECVVNKTPPAPAL